MRKPSSHFIYYKLLLRICQVTNYTYACDSVQVILEDICNGVSALISAVSTGLKAIVRRSGPFGYVPSPPKIQLPKSVICDRSKSLVADSLLPAAFSAPPDALNEKIFVPPVILSQQRVELIQIMKVSLH